MRAPSWLKRALKVELPDEIYSVGCGAQGCVYACGNYAIKIPSSLSQAIETGSKSLPTESSRFVEELKKEAELVRKLDHANVLRLVDYFANPPILVYELADGNLEDCGSMNLRDVLLVAIQVCEALRYLHSRGVVHGGLKPSNLLVIRGFVKVRDLSSLTHLLTAASGSHPRMCAPGCCAPEQLFIDLKTNPKTKGSENRVDVYQLVNVVLSVLGVRPLDGSERDEDEVRKRVEHVEIKELGDLLARMLIKEPWLRPSIDGIEEKLLAIWRKHFDSK